MNGQFSPPHSTGWYSWPAIPETSVDVFCARGPTPGPVALVTAGVHGDEYEGPAALAEVARHLMEAPPVAGTVIVVPVLNPLAFRAGTRTAPQDGLNLARTFPGREQGSEMERLAHAVFRDLVANATYIVDLHSGGVEYDFFPVAGFYGDPHPENRSFQAAIDLGLPALWQLPETQGVLSCEGWKRGKTAIGAEYRGAGRLSPDGLTRYRQGVLNCLAKWGLMEASVTSQTTVQAFEGDWLLASTDGLFRGCCHLGQRVEAGTLLAAICDVRGEKREEFLAPFPGVVLGLRSKVWVQSGNWAVLLGKPMENVRV